jgi:hypothetical protein
MDLRFKVHKALVMGPQIWSAPLAFSTTMVQLPAAPALPLLSTHYADLAA